MENHDFIKGALIGGCLGGLVALFAAPKSGRELYEDITEGVNNTYHQTAELADDVKGYAQNFIDSLKGKKHKEYPNNVVIGGVVGVAVGILAGLLLAPQSGKKLREQLGDEYEEIRDKAEDVINGIHKGKQNLEDKFDDWKETFSTIIKKLSNSKNASNAKSPMNDIVEWANIGLRCYNLVQNRR